MIGKIVTHYRIVEKLGGEGRDVVYKAVDTKLGCSITLKFLPEELSSDRQALEPFEQEAPPLLLPATLWQCFFGADLNTNIKITRRSAGCY